VISRLRHKPLGIAALVYLALITLASIFAPLLAPYGQDEQDLTHTLSGPSAHHWLGTGVLGRDILSRLLYGGRVTLIGVVISSAIYIALGVTLGLLAGYFGGWIDRLVLRLADLVYAVPVIIVLLVVLAIFPGDETAAMVALGLLAAPGLARIVRSVTKGLRAELYIRAAQASGLRSWTIMRRHVLPRLAGTVIVQLSLFGAGAVLLETGLGFLGVGVQRASWGGLISEASQNLGTQPWLLVPSGVLVITFILALGLVGDAVRDAVAERYDDAPPRPRRRAATAVAPAPSTSAPRRDALLSVRGLTVAFAVDGAEVPVVTDVDLDVMPGEAVGIVGESGCGKSVTALSILGLLRGGGRIVVGSVVFEGAELVGSSALNQVRGARIGWISQDPIASLDPCFSAGSQIAEVVRRHTGCSRRAARRRAVELLELVRLPEPAQVAKRFPHQLSGGMAQRVGIAAAIAGDPVMLIADEPTTALDVTVQAEILDLLRELQASGMAIVLVTHDWGVLSDLCERGIVMYAGQVVEQAGVAEMVPAPRHPYTAGLLASNPVHAVRGQPLPAIEGVVPAPADWPVGCRFQARCAYAQDDCGVGPIALVEPGDVEPGDVEPHGAERRTRCLHHDQLRAAPANDTELVSR
jgi:oligopeptide/dipeptide ABC transporter ATP-binding protein